MRAGVAIFALAAGCGVAGAIGGYVWARARGEYVHRFTNAEAGFIFLGTLGYVVGAFVFG